MKKSGILRLAVVFITFMAGGVFVATWAVVWFIRGDHLTAALCVGAVALLVGLTLHLAYSISGRARPRTEFGPDGTCVRAQRFPDVAFGAGLLTGVVSAAAYLVFSQFGSVSYVPSGVIRVAFPAACAFYVVFGVPVLYRMVKFRAGSHLRIGPHGFEVWDGQWNSFARGAWDDVEQILDHPLRGKTTFTEMIVFVLSRGRSAKLVTNTLTANSDALREWVRFYWLHPERRGELVDSRGIRRLEEQRFTLNPTDG
ncbi:hypothetical protein [Mycolicibacterium smegmatis]|uniref:Uncharacterized protein n=1 Tax=Mycolicibacterium smegmatis (strain MKD8) TaxID=1214915 RepID=A0A2U9Q018_MYCSE|nr:hypothetical protein [Mycolicibacterium smegmatis]AWT57347.1 hypothetical protein D806_064140 [Mycolicibacterium smegmatis MKD8]